MSKETSSSLPRMDSSCRLRAAPTFILEFWTRFPSRSMSSRCPSQLLRQSRASSLSTKLRNSKQRQKQRNSVWSPNTSLLSRFKCSLATSRTPPRPASSSSGAWVCNRLHASNTRDPLPFSCAAHAALTTPSVRSPCSHACSPGFGQKRWLWPFKCYESAISLVPSSRHLLSRLAQLAHAMGRWDVVRGAAALMRRLGCHLEANMKQLDADSATQLEVLPKRRRWSKQVRAQKGFATSASSDGTRLHAASHLRALRDVFSQAIHLVCFRDTP